MSEPHNPLHCELEMVHTFDVACLDKREDVNQTYIWVLHKFGIPHLNNPSGVNFLPGRCKVYEWDNIGVTVDLKKPLPDNTPTMSYTLSPLKIATPRRKLFNENCVGKTREPVYCWCTSKNYEQEEKHIKTNFLVADLDASQLGTYYAQVEGGVEKEKPFIILEDTVILWEYSEHGQNFHFKLKDSEQCEQIQQALQDEKEMGCIFEGLVTTDEEVDPGIAHPKRHRKLLSFRGGIYLS